MPVGFGATPGAASSVLDSLNSAALAAVKQQQQLAQYQQAQQQRQYENERQLQQQGAVPAEIENGPGNSSGFTTRAPNPAAQGGGQMVTEPISGKKWYVPTASEKEQQGLNDSNSFVAAPGSDTENFLQDVANVPPGTRIPFAHVGAVGTLGDQMQKAADAAAKKKQTAIVTKDASDKAAALGLSIPEGAEVPFGQLNEFMQALQPKEKAEKPARTRVDLTNFNQPVSVNEDTNEITPLKLPPGVKRAMSPAQEQAAIDRETKERESKQETQSKGITKVQQKHDSYLAQEKAFQDQERDQWDLHERLAKLADSTQNPDTTTVYPPKYNAKTGEITEGEPRQMNANLRASLDADSKQAEAKAKALHQRGLDANAQAANIRKSMGWGEFAKPQASAAAAGAGQAPTAAPKTATLADIRAYAQKNGIAEADAVRKAKAEGYVIAGQ